MKFVFSILLILTTQLWASEEKRTLTPRYYGLATGKLYEREIHPWPVNVLSIGHTNASYQGYGGTPYFHHGLDIRAQAGESVFSSTPGKVVNIENYAAGDLYWEVAVLDEQGFLWQYHHIDRRSIPKEIHDAFKTGTSIKRGTKLGAVVNWPIATYGERYHHIHLNILDGNRRYLSPFLFLEPLDDRSEPQIMRIGLLKNGRELNASSVKGAYSIYAEIHDLVMHDKFIVPPHRIEMEINGQIQRTVWNFEALPGGADEEALVEEFYVKSMVCGNYSCRRPVMDLGFQFQFPNTPGQHQLRLKATDFNGNTSVREFAWSVETF